MMNRGRPIEKIIWAIDAFDEETAGNRFVLETLRLFHEISSLNVVPMYILGPVETALPLPNLYGDPAWVPEVRQAAEERLKQMLPGPEKAPFLKPSEIVVHAATTQEEAVTFLSAAARAAQADAIIVRSHSRSGVERFFLGSFAETLLFHAELPVFVIGTHVHKQTLAPHLLFATDFGDHAKQSFRKAMDLAIQLGARLTIFHAAAPPTASGLDFEAHSRLYEYQGEFVTLRQILEDQIEHQTRRANAWVDWARQEGLDAEAVIDESGGAIDELIVQSAHDRQATMILMEAKSGPWVSALLGSQTRQVLRGAECPVIVLPQGYFRVLAEASPVHRHPPDAHPR